MIIMKKHLLFSLFISYTLGQSLLMASPQPWQTEMQLSINTHASAQLVKPTWWHKAARPFNSYFSCIKQRPLSTLAVSLVGIGCLGLGAVVLRDVVRGKSMMQSLRDLAFSLSLLTSNAPFGNNLIDTNPAQSSLVNEQTKNNHKTDDQKKDLTKDDQKNVTSGVSSKIESYPMLKNIESASCWQDSVVWLLFSMPEFVQLVLKNESQDAIQKKLAILFSAMNSNNETMITKAQAALFDQSCLFMKKGGVDKMADAGTFLTDLITSLARDNKTIEKLFGMEDDDQKEIKLMSSVDLDEDFRTECIYKDGQYVVNPAEYSNEIVRKFTKLGDYYVATVAPIKDEDALVIPKEIDFSSAVDEELKKKSHGSWTYKLTGMVMGGYGHATAYALNEDTWLFFDDLTTAIQKKNPPLTFTKTANSRPLVLIYKKQ